ncbi:MAG: cell envelope integrity protein TolA [Hyphomicrobiaceae bacterium]|nr:cell envelope integrity protein TolA [Hyphomicrobiaceae bacterium]
MPVSFLLHGAMLLWAFLHIMHTPDMVAPLPETIEVSMITPSDFLALKKGDVNSTELDAKPKDVPPTEMSKKEAEKPKPVEGPPPAAEPPPPQEEVKPPEPPKPEPPKEEPKVEAKPPEPPKTDPIADQIAAQPPKPPEPAPGPTPEELKKIEDEKQAEEAKKAEELKKLEEAKKAEEAKKEEEKKKAEDAKKEEEKKKAEEKKRKEKEKKLAEAKKKKEEDAKKKASEADRLAALLDKTPDKRGAQNAATAPEKETDYKGPTAGAREGNANRLSVREADQLNSKVAQQLKQCWRLPGAGGGIETAVVTVSWRLREDGSLDGEPTLEGAQSDPLYQQAADAAMRAVKNCSPFDLPQDKYQFWSKITFDFDPREMMR